jgi:hypothetical protein
LDVDILRRACLKFQKLLMEKTTVDPFRSAITIAATCMQVFRKNFLKKECIGLIPHQGYRHRERQSCIAIKWLKWLHDKEGWRTQHAANGGEARVPGVGRVDGLCR